MPRQEGKAEYGHDKYGRTIGRDYPFTIEEYEQITDWVKEKQPAYYKSMMRSIGMTASMIKKNEAFEWWIGSLYVMGQPFETMGKLIVGKPVSAQERQQMEQAVDDYNWQIENRKPGKGTRLDLKELGLT